MNGGEITILVLFAITTFIAIFVLLIALCNAAHRADKMVEAENSINELKGD